MSADLVEFYRAQLDEDEQVARAAIADDGGQDGGFEDATWLDDRDDPLYARIAKDAANLIRATAVPRRVLAEVESKRLELDELLALPHYAWEGRQEYGCPKYTDPAVWSEVMGDAAQICTCGRDAHVERMLRLKVRPYANDPSYLQEWRP